jgi:serine/threonine-protein kinase HipA
LKGCGLISIPSPRRQKNVYWRSTIETACDVAIAMNAYRDYGLTAQQIDRVLQQVQAAVHGWRNEASQLQIPCAEQDLMASAFEP